MTPSVRARALYAELEALGVTIEELAAIRASSATGSRPTVAEYASTVAASYRQGTARTYASYWKLLVALHGEREVRSLTFDDCAAVVEAAATRALRCRRSEGRSARENCVGALRAFFERARRSGLVTVNPAAELEKPRRRASRRRGLTVVELGELRVAIAETSRDPESDLLLVEFHLQSGARRRVRTMTGECCDARRKRWRIRCNPSARGS